MTVDPKSAREHARAMGGTIVEAMPILPLGEAASLPDDISAEVMAWEETIAAGDYFSKPIGRGARTCLADLYGDACASLLLFNAEQPNERFNVADTIKVQWNAYLEPGRVLLSDIGRVMCSILTYGWCIFGPLQAHKQSTTPSNGSQWLYRTQNQPLRSSFIVARI